MIPTPTTAQRLVIKGARKHFGATVALAGVDLSVDRSQVMALVGENGAGKSTLMKILSGAVQPDQGEMWIDGEPYKPSNPLAARKGGVAMIYQELSLAPHLTVMENILLGAEPMNGPLINWKQMRRQATEALTQLGRPDIRPDMLVSDLSLAQKQLVEIARAVAIGCRVLVLDEPTSSLAQADIRRMFDLILRLKSQGLAIVYISHFLEEVREISDRFTVLRDGRSVGAGITAQTPMPQIINLMVGRDIDDLYPRSHRQSGEAMLEISNLAGETKPRDASLTLHRGQVLGIAGLIGAGRTEFLRCIFGLDPVRRGMIRLGLYQGPTSPDRRLSQGMGMLSEDRKSEGLALNLSIAENLTLTRLPPLVNPSKQEFHAQQLADKLGIRCRSTRQPVGDLSGGNQQKVAIARLLHHDVDVLLLDEPTRGVDVGSKAQIYHLIDELALAGKAVMMVSSYLPELLGVCDRIAVMCKGRLGPAVPANQTNEHQIMLQATGTGEAA
jgi:ribose transport system ATP-binding protein